MVTEVGCCTKYFLFFFNVLFWLVGLTLLGIGIWAWSEKGTFDNLTMIGSLPLDPVLVIIVIAVIMFLLSFAGCLGSLRENITLLKIFNHYMNQCGQTLSAKALNMDFKSLSKTTSLEHSIET